MIRDNDRVSSWQMTVIVISAINAVGILVLPRKLADGAGPDGWLALIMSHAVAAVAIVMIVKLGSRFVDQTFIEYAQVIVGRPLGLLIGGSIALAWLFLTARTTRQFGDVIKMFLLDRTPIEVILLSFLLLAAVLLRHGVEPMARLVEILFPLFPAALVIYAVFGIIEADFSNLRPVLENGITPVIKAAGEDLLSFQGIGPFLMLLPFMVRPERAKKAGLIALSFNLLMRIGFFVITVAILGVQETAHEIWPGLAIAKIIQVGEFFERVDAVFMAIWITVSFTTLVVYYYLSSLAISQLVRFRTPFPVVLPLLPVIYVVSLIPTNIIEASNYSDILDMAWAVSVLIVPSGLLLIATIRGLGRTKQQAEG